MSFHSVQKFGMLGILVATLSLGWVTQSADASAEKTVIVKIEAMQFRPKEISISFGQEIEWINNDLVPHTATSAGNFDSKTIEPGKSWKFKPKKRGLFKYVCSFHPAMSGSIEVDGRVNIKTDTNNRISETETLTQKY